MVLHKSFYYGYVSEKIKVDKQFWAKASREMYNSDKPLISSQKVSEITKPHFLRFIDETKKYFIQSCKASLLGVFSFLSFFFIKGLKSRKKKHVSGKKIVSPKTLSLKLKLKRQASDISIGGIPLVKNTETQHMLITGGTGSGKTNCIHHFLSQIKKSKKKTVIIDTSGIFVERYFDPTKDIILNPLDSRSSPWHPWVECKNNSDYDELAECFIPRSFNEHEDYWRTTARSLFSSVLKKTEYSKKTSELKDWLLTRPLHELAQFVQGTKAAAHIDLSSEKTAGSIRSVASSFLGCLDYMDDIDDNDDIFSIHEWMQKDDDSSLFLLMKPSQRSALSPLISSWISLALRNLLQLTPSLDRRIWFIIDELPTLNKVKDLESFLAEGRKYGGCGLLALQSPSQLDAIYGQNVTKTIIGNCSTKIVFSEQDPIIADLISKSFGERETMEWQESISYGANTMRDGVSLSENKKRVPLVSASDIQSLKRNQAFLKLPGDLPITKLKLKIKK